MLEARDDDLVARAGMDSTPGGRDQVEGFRRPAGQDEAGRIPHAEECRHDS